MAMTDEEFFVYRELTPEDIESYLELGYFQRFQPTHLPR